MRMNRVMFGATLAAALTIGGADAAAQAQGKAKGHDRTPPGLAKKGGLPPGQAKKLHRTDDGVVVLRDVFGRNGYRYVRTEPFGASRYVYYRDREGRLRRAVVRQGTQRLTFENVPSIVLRQVLARLY